MKYQAGQRRKALEYEKALVDWWKKNQIFEKSVENRPIDKSYVFYDGPPFITGNPHHGTLLSSIVKDAVPRYWTMNGYRVERRWGWDCHGLPAENFVEKQLGITDRRDIGTKWSLEDYIIKARESMVANSETWRSTIDRVGRWVDFDNCYRTMNKDFMESVWWAFKKLYDAGKIYEGAKVLMYDTKFATPVSKAEVTMDNDAYQTVTDPSAYVKFMINGGELEGACLLAWTTTPWTLIGNMALAVNKDLTYALYRDAKNRRFITLKGKMQDEDWQEIDTFKGHKLVGLSYEPLFLGETGTPLVEWRKFKKNYYEADDANAHKVYSGAFVGAEEGTGIVHIAPAYGEDDFELCRSAKVPVIDVLDDNGFYLSGADVAMKEAGVRPDDNDKIHAWKMNKIIAKCLEGEKKPIHKIEYIQHEYPFNPRSKERIMYRAFPSWFFDIDGQKQMMLEENENINWFPGYLKHGRFAKNIEVAPDWNLSRDRFWATAMPVWKSEEGTVLVIGSYDELRQYSGKELDDYHRPWVDEIEFDALVDKDGHVMPATSTGGAAGGTPAARSGASTVGETAATGPVESNVHLEHFKRIEKVLDCWFESGSMPFAQLHYPFENKEKFEHNYPADFIVEYVGQVRAWFYYVHAVNTALASIGAFGEKAKTGQKNAYKNVITTGTLAGNDGRKMSKSLGNYTDPNVLMDQYSADALRFLLLSSPVLSGEDFALLDKDVSDVNRKLGMLWNVYDFFTTYAEVEDWDSENSWQPDSNDLNSLKNPLDVWVLSRLHQVKAEIIAGMAEYNIPKALAGVLPFIDDFSNWFVRRSRRRFSKNDDVEDKKEAFWTLYTVLVKTAQVLAPFTPFLSEELYQKMTGKNESVHLLNYPRNTQTIPEVLDNMARTRQIITDALALRMQKSETEDQIKIRQPLARLTYGGEKLDDFYEQIIADEVNVKKVEHADKLTLDKSLTPELLEEGRAREIIRAVQAARKHAGLRQDDQIKLSLTCDLPKAYEALIKSETGATDVAKNQNYSHDEIAKISGENVTISLEKI